MKKTKELTIWDKLYFEEVDLKPEVQGNASNRATFNYKIIERLGTAFGVIFWIYVVTQVFVLDADGLLKTVLPKFSTPFVEYKFFIFLLITTLFLVVIKKYYLVYFYILFFPLIVIFWKIPNIVYKFKSWLLFLGVIEVISSFFQEFKYKIVMVTITLFGFLLVTAFNSKLIISFASLVLALVLLISIIRTIYSSFRTPIFLKFQSEIIKKFIRSDFAQKLIYIDKKIKTSKYKRLTKEQSTTVLTNVQTGVLFHRIIYFWAYQLEKYRASKVSFILSGFSYIWLYLKLVVFLSFINYGVYRIAPSEFVIGSKSFIYFVNYSLNSLFLNETSLMLASGNISLIVRITSGIIGYLLIAVLFLNFIYVAKQSKDDQELTNAIRDIKEQGRELEKQMKNEYSVTTEEAVRKLQAFKTGLLSLILLISSKLPDGYIS